jgi:signal transduction histidine kinase
MSWARIGVRDALIAAGVALVLLVAGLSGPGSAGAGPVGYALLAAGGLVLVVRRRAPVVALVVSGLCAVGYQAAGFDVFAVAYLVAVYSAVRADRRVVTAGVSVAMLGALPLAAVASGLHDSGEAFARARGVLEIAWLIAAGAAGEALRQAERRAEEAERSREQSALRRADEERLHIARELHDSLTHQISVIKVQAEAAVHVAQRRGEPVPEALLVIRDAGREAARELRATLEALRDDEKARPYGLGDVADLVARSRSTGLDVSLTVEGHLTDVPAAVDRTAYRIVQESLTNIARHAGATNASVRIGYQPTGLVIQIEDDGSATPGAAVVPGVGLLGMRERVAALGGELRAEPRGEGGFSVRADIPVGGSR